MIYFQLKLIVAEDLMRSFEHWMGWCWEYNNNIFLIFLLLIRAWRMLMHCVWLKREVCSRLGPEKGNSLYRTNGINLTVNTGCFINTGPLSRISTAVVSMIVNIQQEATSIGQFQYNYQPHAALIHRILAHIITDISTHRLHWYLFNTTIFVSRIYQQRIKYKFVSFILDGKDQFYFK